MKARSLRRKKAKMEREGLANLVGKFIEGVSSGKSTVNPEFLPLTAVDVPEDQQERFGNSDLYMFPSEDVLILHIKGEREAIQLTGENRFPHWIEIATAAQLLPSGAMWAVASVPSMNYTVAVIDISNMVDMEHVDLLSSILSAIVDKEGEISLPFNDLLITKKKGGNLIIDTNAQKETFELSYTDAAS